MKINVKGKTYDLEKLNITGNRMDETEVTITISKMDDTASVYISDNVYLTKIKRAILSGSKDWEIVDIIARADGSISGVKAKGAKKVICIRSKVVQSALTEEQKQKLRVNMLERCKAGALKHRN